MGKNALGGLYMPTTTSGLGWVRQPLFGEPTPTHTYPRVHTKEWWGRQPQQIRINTPTTQKNSWQRPTLPQPTSCSTISAKRLNFQVRKGYWV